MNKRWNVDFWLTFQWFVAQIKYSHHRKYLQGAYFIFCNPLPTSSFGEHNIARMGLQNTTNMWDALMIFWCFLCNTSARMGTSKRTKKKKTKWMNRPPYHRTLLFVFRHEKETNWKEAWRKKRLRFAPSATNPMSDVLKWRALYVDDWDAGDAIRLGIARRNAKRRTGISNTDLCVNNRRVNDLQRPMRL